MKIVENVHANLNEIGHGSTEVQFALFSPKTGKTITPFVKCKDYMSDLFWSHTVGKNASIFGFNWKSGRYKDILNADFIHIAVRIRKAGATLDEISITEPQVKGVKHFLKPFEKALGIKPTKVTVCDEGKNILLQVSKQWFARPYTISALFLFIRLGLNYTDFKKSPVEFYDKAKPGLFVSTQDPMYFRQAKNRIIDLLNGKLDKNQTFAMYASADDVHDGSGIVDYFGYKIV